MGDSSFTKAVKVAKNDGIRRLLIKTNYFLQNKLVTHTPLSKWHQLILNSKYKWVKNRIVYSAPAPPFAKIWISPRNVEYVLRTDKQGKPVLPEARFGGLGQVKAGNWDSKSHRERLSNHWLVQGFQQRFAEGAEWEDTSYYKRLVKKYKNNEDPEKYGFSNTKDMILSRCKFYDRLYREISEKGYKPNHRGEGRHRKEGYQERLEVLVTIDEEGEIQLWNGFHRFTIARILDIEIPVQVVCRHKKWQSVRESIYQLGPGSSRETEYEEHPDIQDLL